MRYSTSSTYPKANYSTAGKIFNRWYFTQGAASGDMRGIYADQNFIAAGSGELLRLRSIVNTTGAAYGGTINAAHFTAKVNADKTVSGSLNALRCTLEVAGATQTPGGKLAALRLDSLIGATSTLTANDAFISVGDNGDTALTNLFCIDVAKGDKKADTLTSGYNTATQVGTVGIKCRINGTTHWILATTTAPST